MFFFLWVNQNGGEIVDIRIAIPDLTCTPNPVTHAALLIHRHIHIQEERRKEALEKYQEQQKEDAVRRAEVAKKIAAEEQARAKQEKAVFANALLTKANAQAEEYLKQAAIKDPYKDNHGRSSKPLFEHVNVHKAGCGGEDGV